MAPVQTAASRDDAPDATQEVPRDAPAPVSRIPLLALIAAVLVAVATIVLSG